MSVKHTHWVWENSRSEGNDRLVLLRIADSCNNDTGRCDPGVKKIAETCKISERTVQRCKKNLVALGELVILQNKGEFGTDQYIIPMKNRLQMEVVTGANLSERQIDGGDNELFPSGDNERSKELKVVTPTVTQTNNTTSKNKPEGNTPTPKSFSLSKRKPREYFEDLLPALVRNDPDTLQSWRDFLDNRAVSLKSPVTRLAAKRLVGDIQDDPNPRETIDRSIARGYKGLFPEEKKSNGRTQSKSKSDVFDAVERSLQSISL